MEKVIDRVTRLIRELGMNDKTFSEKAGVSIGNFAYVRSKGTDLSIENIRRIIQAFPEANRNWIMFGEGNMFDKQYTNDVTINKDNHNNTDSFNTNNSKVFSDLSQALLNQQEITKTAQELTRAAQEQSAALLKLFEKLPVVITQKNQ